MNCDWVEKWLEVPYMCATLRLQGVLPKHQDHISELSLEQVIQIHHNNELWATTILEKREEVTVVLVPECVHQLLSQFESIFQEPSELPPVRVF
jgi:hypothetical protein